MCTEGQERHIMLSNVQDMSFISTIEIPLFIPEYLCRIVSGFTVLFVEIGTRCCVGVRGLCGSLMDVEEHSDRFYVRIEGGCVWLNTFWLTTCAV